ncbi:rho guanine nucleotide exchange factor 25-like [Arctopsyche grandis]|uniref:rho guanine nucleotide exchange factor 25-like n=1 Tax=Arctopsyche grandis TaxID=121162 RepID=UPI00406D7A22
MIGKDYNQSSLMRIVQRQKSVQKTNVDQPRIQVTPEGGQLYKIRKNFETKATEWSRSNGANLEETCPTGNVANLKAKLGPALGRSSSNMSDTSYISINSFTSKSSSYSVRNKTKKRSKFYTLEPESESAYSEHSTGFQPSYDDDSKRLSASMNDLNLNDYENYVKLPFVLPVGESSDNIYEDVDFIVHNNKGQSVEIVSPDGEEDEFGFEMCQMPSVENLVEVFNGAIQNVQESNWSIYKRKLKERIQELIQSETNYIERLKLVVDKYIPELYAGCLPSEDFTKENIFFNIEKILYFHTNVILPSFKLYRRNLRQLACVFVNNEQLFTVYIDYSTNYKMANKIVNDHIEFFKPVQRRLNDKINLSGYLLEPVQRLPKYMLFLDDLKKSYHKYAEGKKEQYSNSGKSSPIDRNSENEDDRVLKAFQDASATVKQMLCRIDDSITISNIKLPLVSLKEQGQLLMHHEFNVTDKAGRRRFMRCFLFEKTLIFTVVDKSLPKEESYIYHDSIPMDRLGLTPPENNEIDKFCVWFMKRNLRNYSLESNNATCNIWVDKISSLLWKEATIRKEELMNCGGAKMTNSLRPKKSGIPGSELEQLGMESNTDTLKLEKYSSLRGVRGEMSSEKKPTKKRTTWYVDENS